MANTNCTLWSQPDPRCETQGRSRADVRRAPGQGMGLKSDRGSGRKRLRKEPSPNPPPTKPSPGSWVHLPFSPKINRAAARGRRGGGAGLARLGAAAVRGADSPVPLARQLLAERRAPGPALRETAILWSLPRPEGWTMETGLPSFPSSSRVCVGSRRWPRRAGGSGAGCHRGPAPTSRPHHHRPLPAAIRPDLNGCLGFPERSPARLSVYSCPSPGRNLR